MRLATGLACLAFVMFALESRATDSSEYSRTESYENEIVIKCPDKNKPTVQVLQAHADVWHVGKESIDLRVDKHVFARVQHYFPECRVVISNLETFMQQAEVQMFPENMAEEQDWEQDVMQETLTQCSTSMKQCEKALKEWETSKMMSSSWFEEYHSYKKIKEFYETLSKEYKNLVTYVPSIGKTFEGRDMPAVHITASKDANRKKFYMQCQIHAREWITGAVCMYIAKQLVDSYKKGDNRIKNLLDDLEIVMIPIVNPDGIVYTWQHDRLWRKNRVIHPGAKCHGVDINRNFPLAFLPKSAAKHSCEEDYPGPSATSEKETQTIMKFFRDNAPIVGALDWHSYGQLLLRPYGYTNKSAPDESFLYSLTHDMAKIMQTAHRTHYKPEKSSELYYCYGIGADWMYSNDAASTNGGIRSASICIELRDTGHPYGFLLPPEQIVPTAEEVYPAVLHYAETMLKRPLSFSEESKSKEPKFDPKAKHPRRHLQ